MKAKRLTLACLLLLPFAQLTVHAAPKPLSVSIEAFDTMKYSVNKIEALPGQKVTVTLRNTGKMAKETMGHNWILLKMGSDPLGYANAAMSAKAQEYQPASQAGKVLAVIPLLGPGETGHISFDAPSAPGKYPFLCSFPAHCAAGMKGVLVVK
ncbi:MAG: plastocyanin/azurin family copper-binding protein [Chthoniobacterales bacterium]